MKLLSVLSLAAFLCFGRAARALPLAPSQAEPVIPPDQLKPGNVFYVDLPALGQSSREPSKPVQMLVQLPANYDRKRPHPVIAFMGGGAGNIDQSRRWFEVAEKRNFIVIAVDYGMTARARDPEFKHTLYGLRVLERSTAYDKGTVVLSGESSGSYGLTQWYAGPTGKAFCAFAVIIGGMLMDAKEVGPRPVLLVAGERDTDRASAGQPRVDVQKSCHEQLRKGGATADIFIQPGVGHEWTPAAYPAMREWLHTKLPNPELRRIHLLSELLKKTELERRKMYYYRELAASWWETSATEEARRKVAEAAK